MNKITFLIFLSLFSVVIYGCTTSEFPPEPGSFDVPVGKADDIYASYAPPNDVYDRNNQIFFLSENQLNKYYK